MTSANVFNWTAVNVSQTLNANARASRSKADNPEMASVFASMMNTNYSATSNLSSDVDSEHTSWSTSVNETDSANAYDRYSYREEAIDTVDENPLADKLTEAADELAGFEEDATRTVAETLGLSEDQVIQAMEDLGITAFDLMEPQNLIQLVMNLTGASQEAELLLNPQVMELMNGMQELGTSLMNQLQLPMEQMDELVAQMDQLENPLPMPEQEGAVVAEPVMEATESASEMPVDSANPNEVTVGESEEEQQTVVEIHVEGDSTEQEPDAGTKDAFAKDNDRGKTGLEAHPTQNSEQAVGVQNVFGGSETLIISEQNTMDTPYLSADTMEIIEQLAEKIKVCISEGTSSMEMQLNPENLGKVYLQVSSREGAINAQLTATNEAVKNALEAQMATLRENLEQAGVKVDAIEVTVASHEFERNLEQDQKREEQEGERAQKEAGRRRNLNLSSLDELSGLMSEEEALVAQIMWDNGNSVDMSA